VIGPNFNFYLLGVIFLILGGGVVASLAANRRDANRADHAVRGQPTPTPLP
jgi:hypothetical protein